MDSTELVPTVAPVSNLDLSGFDSDQLDEKISSLVADFAKSNTDGLDAVLPYIREMQQVLSQRGSARNKSDITFSVWLTGAIKRLKGSAVDKAVAVSRRTIYRRLAKMAGFVPAKTLKVGTLVRSGTTEGRVVEGATDEGCVLVSFVNELTGKPESASVTPLKELTVVRPRAIAVGDLLIFTDIRGGQERRYKGNGKFEDTDTPTGDQVRVAKEKAALKTGKTPKVGSKPGQVSDETAAAETKRHKVKPVTHALVTAEDRAAKKGDVLTEPKPKGKPGPKSKIKAVVEEIDGVKITKLAPVTSPDDRKGFDVEPGEYDADTKSFVKPEAAPTDSAAIL